jgi:hypothetical protein
MVTARLFTETLQTFRFGRLFDKEGEQRVV